MLGQLTPLSQRTFCTPAGSLDAFHALDDSDSAVSSVSQPLLLLAWLHVCTGKQASLGRRPRRWSMHGDGMILSDRYAGLDHLGSDLGD